jgi:hypothetical protein
MSYPIHESLLSQTESDLNSDLLKSYSLSAQLQEFVEGYTDQNKITLNNLLEAERTELKSILDSFKPVDFNASVEEMLLDQLKAWKNKLRHAVYGSGQHVILHNTQTIGIAARIRAAGKFPLSQWGTDLDIKQCLGNDIINPKNIAAPGTHVLAPTVLFAQEGSTIAEASLQKELEFALNAIVANDVTGHVSLLVPVNCGNSHWRLAIIEIENQAIESACLWDSLSDAENLLTSSPAFLTLQKAVAQAAKKTVPVRTKAQGIQTNSSSCMDFVIQQIYRFKTVTNSITAALVSPTDLRLAVAKQIVLSQADLGAAVADKLIVDGNTISSNPLEQELPLVEKNKFLINLAQRKKSQIQFDGFFAKELQKLYTANPRCQDSDTTAEEKLQQTAFTSAYREFLAVVKTDEADNSTTDNTSSSTPRM